MDTELREESLAAPVLIVRDLRKHYGAVVAVDGVCFDVHNGAFVTLLGPSGSGKSTVLGLIAGFIPPTAGYISLAGASVASMPAHRRNIGVVFQNYALFPHMTAFDNIAFPLSVRKERKDNIRARVGSALELVGLSGYGHRRIRELSGGEQQRVALARALVFEPKLLLMDEPLAALDKRLRDKLQGEIVEIQRHLGIAVVYVTHDQAEAFRMSDRVAVLEEGKLAQFASPEELYERPASTFVADFVGDSNLIYGTVTDGARQLVSRATGTRVSIEGAHCGPDVSTGAVAAVLVRPTKVELLKADDSSRPELVRLPGIVQSASYLGEFVRYTIAVAALDVTLLSDVPAGSSHRFVPGDAIIAAWKGADSVVIGE